MVGIPLLKLTRFRPLENGQPIDGDTTCDEVVPHRVDGLRRITVLLPIARDVDDLALGGDRLERQDPVSDEAHSVRSRR